MRMGLWLTADEHFDRAAALCRAQDIPLAGSAAEVPLCGGSREAFLLGVGGAVLTGGAVDSASAARHLASDARAGNVLRRYVGLQRSLGAALSGAGVLRGEGLVLLGEEVAVCPLSPLGVAEASLPPGLWTDILTGEVVSGRLRRMRGPLETPLLARENALLPILSDPGSLLRDGARLTLHWYQPAEKARAALPEGLCRVRREGDEVRVSAPMPWYLVIHQDGTERYLP